MASAGGLSSALGTTSASEGNTLFGQSQGIQGALTPFFQNEMYNPQGLGATTMSQMLTNAGQSTAGALGSARGTAMDMGARTGNLAAIPQLIGNANKAGITQMSNLSNQIGMANANERLQQQQQGAAGLSGIMGQDLSGTFQAGNVENAAIKNLQDAENSTFGHELGSSFASGLGKSLGGMAGGAASMGLGMALPFSNPF
jgi:hypothetical protein